MDALSAMELSDLRFWLPLITLAYRLIETSNGP